MAIDSINYSPQMIDLIIKKIQLDERERCAKIVQFYYKGFEDHIVRDMVKSIVGELAKAIMEPGRTHPKI